ncbi:MAG: molybdopterin-guanine dinucleotide biosynthesis protein B [Candidatus Competibacterales bacterium]|nr:molybdopterin-guanine dinucleotide biosynthesis protein B [Candidatus Competibacterales bacterium]
MLPVIAFVGPSGVGKTTLIERVIAELSARGLRVGVIKQAREDFDVDQPGKDSYRLRKAGIEQLLVAAERQSALIIEPPEPVKPEPVELLSLLDAESLDLVLIEGFRDQALPRIALYRQGLGAVRPAESRPAESRPAESDPLLLAVASDVALDGGVPCLDIGDPVEVANFIQDWASRLPALEP